MTRPRVLQNIAGGCVADVCVSSRHFLPPMGQRGTPPTHTHGCRQTEEAGSATSGDSRQECIYASVA